MAPCTNGPRILSLAGLILIIWLVITNNGSSSIISN
jgi:hypothetical protein